MSPCRWTRSRRSTIAGDSTFALMLEAQARGHPLFYYTAGHAGARDDRRSPRVAAGRGARQERAIISRSATRSARSRPTFDVVLLRQDPPFDMGYITSTHLARAHPSEDPRRQRSGERAQRAGETLCHRISRSDAADADHPRQAAIERFRKEHGDIILKPLYGNGGAGVFRLARGRPEFRLAFDLFPATLSRAVDRAALPAGRAKGDKRIILVDGEAAGAINRVPAENEIRSNMVRGGAAERRPSSRRATRNLCERSGPSSSGAA